MILNRQDEKNFGEAHGICTDLENFLQMYSPKDFFLKTAEFKDIQMSLDLLKDRLFIALTED